MVCCHGYLSKSVLLLGLLTYVVPILATLEKKPGEKVYTNGWAVKIVGADKLKKALKITHKYGFEKVSQIGNLQEYFHLEHPHHPRRSKRSAEGTTELLNSELEIEWVQQLHEIERHKRGVHHQRVVTRGIQPRFADPLWDEQWYLDDKRNAMDLDVNIIPVWNSGISGKGVVVTILDDGIEHNHTDLERNYDPAASWDINDNDPDPFPRYDPTNENKHGTRCAGEVAAQANNSKCGVGVAYNAKIGGVRMLDGRVTDRVEAESLSLNPQYIDIYSASWGPSDDGMTVEGPGTLASAAFLNGVTKGRGGLGSIYVWASGNGGRHDDSCNCDGYTASIYTLSISSSSDHGESPWYSESCSSTLATTLSSGAHGEKRIVTTDLHNQCTERHTGTSASAPLAAGLIALVLEKNAKLTWRDVQHIVVHTSNSLPLRHDPDWRINGIGLYVNEKFGFGLLDGEKMVAMVDPKKFQTVPPKRECKGKLFSDARSVRWDQQLLVDIYSDACKGTDNEIRYLEHVQVVLTIEYPRRGDLTIFVTTPMGTKSCLLPVRSEDSSDEGFKKWPFMTTHAWGEDPRGIWTLEIKDGGDSRSTQGTLLDWQLILHGTKTKPHHQNLSHPDIPKNAKANKEKKPESTVQITQITYTFGQGTTSSNIPNPQTSFQQLQQQKPSYLQNIINAQRNAVNLVPNPNSFSLQNTQAIGSPNVEQFNYNMNGYSNFQKNNIRYPAIRNTNNDYDNIYHIPSSFSSYYENTFSSSQNNVAQQQVATQNSLSGRSINRKNYGSNMQMYLAQNNNVWDLFNRFNGKRALKKNTMYPRNSLGKTSVRRLDKMRK